MCRLSKFDTVTVKHFHVVNVCTIRPYAWRDGFLLNFFDLTFSLHTVTAFSAPKPFHKAMQRDIFVTQTNVMNLYPKYFTTVIRVRLSVMSVFY